MKDFVERMVAEEKELNEKIRKIHLFYETQLRTDRANRTISDRALILMGHQMHAMELYAYFLRERILLAELVGEGVELSARVSADKDAVVKAATK